MSTQAFSKLNLSKLERAPPRRSREQQPEKAQEEQTAPAQQQAAQQRRAAAARPNYLVIDMGLIPDIYTSDVSIAGLGLCVPFSCRLSFIVLVKHEEYSCWSNRGS